MIGKPLRRLRAPTIDAEGRRVLLLFGAATFFNQYDVQLVSLASKQIQAELAIPEPQIGFSGSPIRLDSLPAFAPDYRTLIALQCLSRTFIAAEFLLAFIFEVEEFRPENRGWGVAMLGTLAILGSGAAMILSASSRRSRTDGEACAWSA